MAWLRGSAANESGACGTCTPTFRSRPASKLGDIIHSAPTYVAAPSFGYPDSMEAVAYSAFAVAKANRTPMIYVGANDGMLHAFNASTGVETIAYVPTPVYRNLSAHGHAQSVVQRGRTDRASLSSRWIADRGRRVLWRRLAHAAGRRAGAGGQGSTRWT